MVVGRRGGEDNEKKGRSLKRDQEYQEDEEGRWEETRAEVQEE